MGYGESQLIKSLSILTNSFPFSILTARSLSFPAFWWSFFRILLLMENPASQNFRPGQWPKSLYLIFEVFSLY